VQLNSICRGDTCGIPTTESVTRFLPVIVTPRPNTVYLRSDGRAAVDRWSVAVVGVFELVVGHFAFDDPRIGAWATRGEQFVEDFGGDALVRGAEDVRGKNRGGSRWCAERPVGTG